MTHAAPQSDTTPIGGFFEWRPPDNASSGTSVLDAWTGGRPFSAFVSARAAFAALAAMTPRAKVWAPAFLCRDLITPALGDRVRFYPTFDGFEPDLATIDHGARPGDLVVLVAYFGLPLSDGVRAFAAARSDLNFCEDRAHALDAGEGLDSGWRLYSPRKLMNVADGGLLVADGEIDPPQPTEIAESAALWAAPRLRAADPAGAADGAWHAANQLKEAAMTASPAAITPQSLDILGRTAIAPLAAARLRNWRRLDAELRPWSVLSEDPHAPPLGYVLDLEPEARERMLAGLHACNIFAAVHWRQIAADPAAFPREAEWSRRLITLPCDHRYGDADMDRIIRTVTSLLA